MYVRESDNLSPSLLPRPAAAVLSARHRISPSPGPAALDRRLLEVTAAVAAVMEAGWHYHCWQKLLPCLKYRFQRIAPGIRRRVHSS